MKWFMIIYNILDFIHDKILHPIFGDEYQTKRSRKHKK